MVQQTVAHMEKVSISKGRNRHWHWATATWGRAANQMEVKELWATKVPEPVRGRGAKEVSTDSSFPSRPTGESTHDYWAWQQSARQKKFAVVVAVQPLSHVRLFSTQWTAAHHASLSFTLSQSLLKFTSTGSVIQLSHPLVPFSLRPPFFPASGSFPTSRLFASGVNQSFQWYSGLLSFRVDWLDLLAVQGTLKSLLQHHKCQLSILWHSVFFMIQLSHPYMTNGKTIVWLYETLAEKQCLCFLTC